MARERYTEEVKTRVRESTKAELEELAAARDLDVSDLVREALREYMQRSRVPLPLAAVAGGRRR